MDKDELKPLIQEVLEQGYLMSLATLDDGGVWAADVIYIHDGNFNIFWMSNPDARHSRAILTRSQVAGTITVSDSGEDNLGIQFSGMAMKIDGPRFNLALKHYEKRKKPAPKDTDDVLGGDSWYQLSPSKIELIHEKLFGFEKKVFDP